MKMVGVQMLSNDFVMVRTPRGPYVGWGAEPGQQITGKVLIYSPDGGTDYDGAPCPQVGLELVEPGYSVNKRGNRTEFKAGQPVVITAGQASLKRSMIAARLNEGDLVRITLDRVEPTRSGHKVKLFEIEVARAKKSA